jgi:hypothetical protein
MSTISYDEFLLLPKKEPTKKLIPGNQYYIRNGVRKRNDYIDVYVGTFDRMTSFTKPDGKKNEYFQFTEVKYLVKPSWGGSVVPSGFAKSGWIYTEVIPIEPTAEDIENKKVNIQELEEFIHERKALPVETPAISFIGKDYRKAKRSFMKKNMTQSQRESRLGSSSGSSSRASSRASSRSSSRSSSRGGKRKTRKNKK